MTLSVQLALDHAPMTAVRPQMEGAWKVASLSRGQDRSRQVQLKCRIDGYHLSGGSVCKDPGVQGCVRQWSRSRKTADFLCGLYTQEAADNLCLLCISYSLMPFADTSSD